MTPTVIRDLRCNWFPDQLVDSRDSKGRCAGRFRRIPFAAALAHRLQATPARTGPRTSTTPGCPSRQIPVMGRKQCWARSRPRARWNPSLVCFGRARPRARSVSDRRWTSRSPGPVTAAEDCPPAIPHQRSELQERGRWRSPGPPRASPGSSGENRPQEPAWALSAWHGRWPLRRLPQAIHSLWSLPMPTACRSGSPAPRPIPARIPAPIRTTCSRRSGIRIPGLARHRMAACKSAPTEM